MTDEITPQKPGMDRRTFVVKAAMGAAGIGALGATGAGLVVPISTARLNIRRFPYWGAKKVGGPAPQGIPLIPVRVNAQGVLEGVPQLENAPVAHSLDWYKYCSHEAAPGLSLDFTEDNKFRYFNNPLKLATAAKELGGEIWYASKLGEEIKADEFTEVGMGAPFNWRSEGQEQINIVTGIVIRIDPSKMSGNDASSFVGHTADKSKSFVAYCSFCAHFCCVPGYQESAIPLKKGLFDKIYCTCHDSVYDPYQIKKYTFPPDF